MCPHALHHESTACFLWSWDLPDPPQLGVWASARGGGEQDNERRADSRREPRVPQTLMRDSEALRRCNLGPENEQELWEAAATSSSEAPTDG